VSSIPVRCEVYSTQLGPPREILQGGTTLVCCSIKPLVNFHKSLREFYIIIYLNKLKLHVVENTPKHEKIKIKCLWLRLRALQRFMGPFLALRAPDRCTGWTPSHMPWTQLHVLMSVNDIWQVCGFHWYYINKTASHNIT